MPFIRQAPALGQGRPPARLVDYVAIARLDHWIKHLFVLPGILFAWLMAGTPADAAASWMADAGLTLLMAAALASANYTINEWLDAPFDAAHPYKRQRPTVVRRVSGALVALQYGVLLGSGLLLASLMGPSMLITAGVFAVFGIVYNVPPVRAKDRVFVDVLVESFNNPLRFLMGWFAVLPGALPPASLLLGYWFGGAFLMAAKRVSEHRAISSAGGGFALAAYRPSFARYTQASLVGSTMAYALICAFMMAVFVVKHRIEYLLTAPLIVALFAVYMALAVAPDSAAAKPEALLRQPLLLALAVATLAAFVVLSQVDLPWLGVLTSVDLVRIPQVTQ